MTTAIRYLSVSAALALVGWGCGADQSDEADRDLSLAPAESTMTVADVPEDQPAEQPRPPARAPSPPTAPRPARPAPAPRVPTLEVGTRLTLYAADTLTSRHNKTGEPVRALITTAVLDPQGSEVIPAGAVFLGTITDIAPAESPGGQGRMAMTFHAVEYGGVAHPLTAVADSLGARMKGRGVTVGDAAKVGAGAVVGAVAGRIIGGNRTGTAVGAAAGAAAGVGIAAATRDIDIILDAGAPIDIVLSEGFRRPAS